MQEIYDQFPEVPREELLVRWLGIQGVEVFDVISKHLLKNSSLSL